jgi:hypothetical protein
MRGAQQSINRPMPGLCRKPDSGFLTVLKRTVKKSIFFCTKIVSSLSIAHLIAPAFAVGEMARTFHLWRDEENDQASSWNRALNRMHFGLLCWSEIAACEKTTRATAEPQRFRMK